MTTTERAGLAKLLDWATAFTIDDPRGADAERVRYLIPDPPNPRPDSAAGTRKQVPL